MSVKFKKPNRELFIEAIKKFARNKSKSFNEMENKVLTAEFLRSLLFFKERNSKAIWNAYYIPKAISAILKEEGYLTTYNGAVPRAKAMLLSDLANGVIDELYRFK